MKLQIIFLIIVSFLCILKKAETGLLEFNDMVRKYVKQNPGYVIGYGHYCGKGNTPVTPVDKIDECCKVHDECYGSWKAKFNTTDTYFAMYYWALVGDKIVCDNFEPRDNYMCSCDKAIAECLKQNWGVYNKKHYMRQKAERYFIQFLNMVGTFFNIKKK